MGVDVLIVTPLSVQVKMGRDCAGFLLLDGDDTLVIGRLYAPITVIFECKMSVR